MPVQLLHRDAEFRESVSAPYGFTGRYIITRHTSIAAGQVPVLDLDLLHDKARVRLEREPPPPEAPSAPPSPSPSDIEQASTSVVPGVELESLREALSAHPAALDGRRTCRVSAAVWTGEAEARAAEAQTLEIKVATLSDSLAAEGVRAGTLLAHRSLVSSKQPVVWSRWSGRG